MLWLELEDEMRRTKDPCSSHVSFQLLRVLLVQLDIALLPSLLSGSGY